MRRACLECGIWARALPCELCGSRALLRAELLVDAVGVRFRLGARPPRISSHVTPLLLIALAEALDELPRDARARARAMLPFIDESDDGLYWVDRYRGVGRLGPCTSLLRAT